jgi:hypothetical protein
VVRILESREIPSIQGSFHVSFSFWLTLKIFLGILGEFTLSSQSFNTTKRTFHVTSAISSLYNFLSSVRTKRTPMGGRHLATLMKRTFSDLYPGGAQFEPRPGTVYHEVCLRSARHISVNTLSFPVPSNSSLTIHPNIRHYVAWATDSNKMNNRGCQCICSLQQMLNRLKNFLSTKLNGVTSMTIVIVIPSYVCSSGLIQSTWNSNGGQCSQHIY